MRRNIFFSFIIIAALLLSGCSFGGEIGTMLAPPAMSIGREALTGAIREAIGGSYELVYPQAGSYRTGIISEDLDGDGETEAICFYRAEGKLGFLVMQSAEEGWRVMSKGKSNASSVGRVAFGDLTGDGLAEVIVGWQYLTEADGSFEIFSISSTKAKSRHSGLYTRFVVLEGEPDALVVVSRNAETRAVTASLVGIYQNEIGVINTVAMNDRAVDYMSIQPGKVKGALPAVFVDEQLEGGQFITEVLVINDQGRLSNELINQVELSTLRYTAAYCKDIDKDGITEVPAELALPSYRRNGVDENLYLIQWNAYDGQQFYPVSQSFINSTENFSVKIPEEWEGRLKIERPEDNDRSFLFKTRDGSALFTIRVYGLAEFSEDLMRKGWRKLYTDSDRVYTVHCEENNPFDVTYTQIYGLFEAIS